MSSIMASSSYTCIIILCFHILLFRFQMVLLILLVRPIFCLPITYMSLPSLLSTPHNISFSPLMVDFLVCDLHTHITLKTVSIHIISKIFPVWIETCSINFFLNLFFFPLNVIFSCMNSSQKLLWLFLMVI